VRFNFFAKTTLAVALMLGAAALGMVVFGGGDRKAIERLVVEGEAALNRHDAGYCVALIHPSYNYDGRDFEQVTKLIRHYVGGASYRSVTFVDPEIEVMGTSASVRLRIKFAGGGMGQMPAYGGGMPLVFWLSKDEDRWMITAIERPER
jgi:hypothetical protein